MAGIVVVKTRVLTSQWVGRNILPDHPVHPCFLGNGSTAKFSFPVQRRRFLFSTNHEINCLATGTSGDVVGVMQFKLKPAVACDGLSWTRRVRLLHLCWDCSMPFSAEPAPGILMLDEATRAGPSSSFSTADKQKTAGEMLTDRDNMHSE